MINANIPTQYYELMHFRHLPIVREMRRICSNDQVTSHPGDLSNTRRLLAEVNEHLEF